MFKSLQVQTFLVRVCLLFLSIFSYQTAWAEDLLEYRIDTAIPQLPQAWNFGELGGIALADDNSFWVQDYENNRLLKLNVNDGRIMTQIVPRFEERLAYWSTDFQGGFSAAEDGSVWLIGQRHLFSQFSSEGKLISENTGYSDIWVTNKNTHTVTHYDKDGQILTRLGNNCEDLSRIFTQKRGVIEVDGSQWVVDSKNHRVLHLDNNDNVILSIGSEGEREGQFKFPFALAIAADNSLWVTDWGNNRLQHFKQDGSFIEQVGSAGNAPTQFNEPSGIDIASDGSLWVVDTRNFRVQHLSDTGVFITEFGDRELFYEPGIIKVASDDSLWVEDGELGNERVRHFNFDGQLIGQLNNASFNKIEDIAFETDGSLWVKDLRLFDESSRIQHFASDGSFIEYLQGTVDHCQTNRLGGFSRPNDVAVQKNGDVWVVDSGNQRVQHLNNKGESISIIGKEFLSSPVAITLGTDDSIWVVDDTRHQILHFDQEGSLIAEIGSQGAKAGQFEGPKDITVVPDDSILVVDAGNRRIQHLLATGEFIKQFGRAENDATIEVLFDKPYDIAIQIDGSMMIGNRDYSAMIHFDFSGNLIDLERLTAIPTSNDFSRTISIIDAGMPANDGSLWKIDRLELSNIERTKDDSIEASINSSTHLDLVSSGYSVKQVKTVRDGSVWVHYTKLVQAGSGFLTRRKLIHYDSDGLFISELPVVSAAYPDDYFFVPSLDGHIWVTEKTSRQVKLIDTTGKVIEHFDAPNENGKEFSGLAGISMDAEGAIWVADPDYHRILKFVPKIRQNVPADYDDVQQILYVSDVNIAGVHYQASLVFKNNLFTLQSISPASYRFMPEAGFDLLTDILTLPLVKVEGLEYNANLKHIGNSQFEILSVNLNRK